MEVISKALHQSLHQNREELSDREARAPDPKPSNFYMANGSREVQRRLRQMQRIAEKAK